MGPPDGAAGDREARGCREPWSERGPTRAREGYGFGDLAPLRVARQRHRERRGFGRVGLRILGQRGAQERARLRHDRRSRNHLGDRRERWTGRVDEGRGLRGATSELRRRQRLGQRRDDDRHRLGRGRRLLREQRFRDRRVSTGLRREPDLFEVDADHRVARLVGRRRHHDAGKRAVVVHGARARGRRGQDRRGELRGKWLHHRVRDDERRGRMVEARVIFRAELLQLDQLFVVERTQGAFREQVLDPRVHRDGSSARPSSAARIETNPRRACAFTVPSGMPVWVEISRATGRGTSRARALAAAPAGADRAHGRPARPRPTSLARSRPRRLFERQLVRLLARFVLRTLAPGAAAIDQPPPRDRRDERRFGCDRRVEPARGLPQVEEDLLHRILGITRVEPPCDRPHEVAVARDDLAHRRCIAGADPGEQRWDGLDHHGGPEASIARCAIPDRSGEFRRAGRTGRWS